MHQPSGNELELNHARAELALSRVEQLRSFSMTQMTTMANWLMASVFAMNGAGVLTSVSAVKEEEDAWIAASIFVAGVIFSLLNAVFLQDFYNNVPGHLEDHHSYWSKVRQTGVRDSDAEESLQIKSASATRLSWLPPTMGWLAGALFISGCVVLGYQFSDSNYSNDRRCEALEHDLLSATPKRSDSLELFKAFSCKPKTRDSVHARPNA